MMNMGEAGNVQQGIGDVRWVDEGAYEKLGSIPPPLHETPSLGESFKAGLESFKESITLNKEGDRVEGGKFATQEKRDSFEATEERVGRFFSGALSGLFSMGKTSLKVTLVYPIVGLIHVATGNVTAAKIASSIAAFKDISDLREKGKESKEDLLNSLTVNKIHNVSTCFRLNSENEVEVVKKELISEKDAKTFDKLVRKAKSLDEGISGLNQDELAEMALIADKVMQRHDISNKHIENAPDEIYLSKSEHEEYEKLFSKIDNVNPKPLDASKRKKANEFFATIERRKERVGTCTTQIDELTKNGISSSGVYKDCKIYDKKECELLEKISKKLDNLPENGTITKKEADALDRMHNKYEKELGPGGLISRRQLAIDKLNELKKNDGGQTVKATHPLSEERMNKIQNAHACMKKESDPYKGIGERIKKLGEMVAGLDNDYNVIGSQAHSSDNLLNLVFYRCDVSEEEKDILERFKKGEYLNTKQREKLKEMDKNIFQPLQKVFDVELEVVTLEVSKKAEGGREVTTTERRVNDDTIFEFMKKYDFSLDEIEAIKKLPRNEKGNDDD